jgi:hypothetical protein
MVKVCEERSVLRGGRAVRLFNELARKRICGLVLPRTVGPANFFCLVATPFAVGTSVTPVTPVTVVTPSPIRSAVPLWPSAACEQT